MVSAYYYQKALAAERCGEYEIAIGSFRVCLELAEPDRGDVWFHIGWCIEHQDGLTSTEAVECYQKGGAFAADTDCRVNSWFRAGWLLMHQKRTSEALCMFERAVSAGEESETTSEPYRHALYWLGVVLEQDGRFLNAIERYRAVQSFSAQLAPEAMYRELRSLSAIGRFEDALRVVLRFPDSPPPGLEPKRFDQLRAMMNEEQDQLIACLRDAAPEVSN